MISKRFNGNKATGMTKRKLGLESLENREMLNGLGLLATPDVPDYDQTSSANAAQTFASFSPFSVDVGSVTATVVSPTSVQVDFTTDDTASYKILYKQGTGAYKTFKTVAGENGAQSILVTGLKAGAKYTFAVQDVDGVIEESSVISTPLTVTVTGITTTSATLKWSTPDSSLGVKAPYTVVVTSGDGLTTYFSQDTRSTSIEVTGLPTNTTGLKYEIYAVGSVNPIVSGTINTEANGDGADVVVGAPKEIKTSFIKATTSKPIAQAKISWIAPANYDGAYTITLEGDNGSFTVDVPKGTTSLTLSVGDVEVQTGDIVLEKDITYTVSVTAKQIGSTANISSSTTNFATSAINSPTQPEIPGLNAAALTGVPGGLTLSVDEPSDTTGIVGYYVGVYTTSTPPLPGSAGLTFIAAADASTATVNFSGVSTKAKAVAYSVKADGTYSLAKILVSVTPETTPIVTEKVSGIDGKLTFEQDDTDPTSGTLSWTQAADLANKTLKGWYVSYSIDKGKTWIDDGFAAADDVGETIEHEFSSNLTALGIAYQFKVVASYEDSNSDESLGKAVQFNMTKVLHDKVAAPGKAKESIIGNDGTSATVQWTYPVGAAEVTFDIKVYDSNKALIASSTQTSDPTETDPYTYSLTGLTPGSKYFVEITALTEDPYVKSTTYKITVQTPAYQPVTVKAGKTSVLDAEVTVTDTNVNKDDTNTSYVVEYTNVVDGKGKPDWNTAATVTIQSAEFLQSTSKTISLTGLNPSTQYYVRVVKITTDGTNPIMAANGKEAKLKTATAPTAAISKSGFAMDGTDFGFKFTGTTPLKSDTKGILPNSTFAYKIIVSSSSTTNASTGKLDGDVAEFVMTVANGELTFESPVVKFSDLAKAVASGGLGDLTQFSTLYFQLEVVYTETGETDSYATTYTKAAKIALPKWFS